MSKLLTFPQLPQDSRRKTAAARQPPVDSRLKTAVVRKPPQDSRRMTAAVRQPPQDSRRKTAAVRQPPQDSRHRRQATLSSPEPTREEHYHYLGHHLCHRNHTAVCIKATTAALLYIPTDTTAVTRPIRVITWATTTFTIASHQLNQ